MTTGDNAAIRECLRGASSDLLAYFERRVRVREDAADLLAETMLQAWRRVDAFPPGDNARQRMWLFTVATNVLANHHRSKRRQMALADRLRAQLQSEPPRLDDDEVTSVRDAVLRLHQAQRELVMLIHWDGFNIVEAAELLGLNASTARSRYAAARAVLRRTLSEQVAW